MNPTEQTGAGEFAGRVAIVTGAAGGIGRATALRLAASGAAVLVADRREEVAETGAAIKAAGGTALHRIIDVTDDEQVRGMVGAARERFGRLDVLVNNAGAVGRPAPLAELDPEAFDRTLAINARGTFLG
ncbi:MAG TPA: SDR family NAD(P)-dependent oxidoreductase, partial [Solirubrobacterales bacterium]|nr:SDR family NAD(P)-dependent oxidoreductase [Solirubrobacterales bacterium]